MVTSLVYSDEETTTVADEAESYANDETMYENNMIAEEEMDDEMEDPVLRRHTGKKISFHFIYYSRFAQADHMQVPWYPLVSYENYESITEEVGYLYQFRKPISFIL